MAVFLDSNVVLYALSDDLLKGEVSRKLLASDPPASISVQVLNECSHVLRRKQRWSPEQVARHMEIVLGLVTVATALAGNCELLYTEDMQDGQVIEGRMTLRNPYAGPTP